MVRSGSSRCCAIVAPSMLVVRVPGVQVRIVLAPCVDYFAVVDVAPWLIVRRLFFAAPNRFIGAVPGMLRRIQRVAPGTDPRALVVVGRIGGPDGHQASFPPWRCAR